MVFGWGKKKVEENTRENPKQKEIKLHDVIKITNDLLKLRQNQTVAEIKSLRNQISPLIQNLYNIAGNLEKDDLNVDDIDKHLRIIVVRGKKQVIDVIKKESSELPEVSSFEDALVMNNSMSQKLKKIGDVLGRQTRVIHIFAKKYAEELKKILSDMNSLNGEIILLINNFQKSKSSSEEIIQITDKLKRDNEESKNKQNRIKEIEITINNTNEKIKVLEKKIEKIKSGSKYIEFLTLKKKLASFEDTKHHLNEEITSQFTKISRPLGRYEHVSLLDKDQKSLLIQLINDPFEALIPSNQDEIIVILENVRKGISSGSISVKDMDKTMMYLTEIEEMLEGLIRKVSLFFENKKKIQEEISQFDDKELLDLQNQLSKLSEQKNESEKKILLFKKEISDNYRDTPKKTSKIENLLKDFSNTSYTILETAEN